MKIRDHASDYSDLSPEVLEIVRAVQSALLDKRARRQIEATDRGPSALELAYSRESAKRPALSGAIASHPRLIATLVESACAAIISEAVDGTVLTWNKGAEQIFGYAGDEVIGQSHICLFPDFLKHDEAKIWKQVTKGEPIRHYETVCQHKSGRLVDLAMSVSPIFEEEKVVRMVVVATTSPSASAWNAR